MPVGSGASIGQTDLNGNTCLLDLPDEEIWAKETVTIGIRRADTSQLLWSWSGIARIEGSSTTSEYTSTPFLLASKNITEYVITLTVFRSAIDAPTYGKPIGNPVETSVYDMSVLTNSFGPVINPFHCETLDPTHVAFKATATRFVGDHGDPQYGDVLSTDPHFANRGNSLWVYQVASFSIERIQDGVEIWSSPQSPAKPVIVDDAEATETYTSNSFSTVNRDLSTLRAKVTIIRYLKGYEGILGWHQSTHTATKYIGIYIVEDLITNLAVSGTVFDPYAGEDVGITYDLLRPATVTISILGANGSRSAIFWNPNTMSYSPSKWQAPGGQMATWSGILDLPEMDGYYGSTETKGIWLATGGGYTITVSGTATDGSGISDIEDTSVSVVTTW
jgi:hypothetical protein